MKNHHFWLLLGAAIAISITVGVVWGIYTVSWVMGISVWICTECILITLLVRHALKMEEPNE